MNIRMSRRHKVVSRMGWCVEARRVVIPEGGGGSEWAVCMCVGMIVHVCVQEDES